MLKLFPEIRLIARILDCVDLHFGSLLAVYT